MEARTEAQGLRIEEAQGLRLEEAQGLEGLRPSPDRSKAIADAEADAEFTLPVLLKRFLHVFKGDLYVGVGQVIAVSRSGVIVRLSGAHIKLTENELKKCSRISTQAERNILLKQSFEMSNMITKLTHDNDLYASALASLGSKVWPHCAGACAKTMPLPLRARRVIDALNDNKDEIAKAISPIITPTSSPIKPTPTLKRKVDQAASLLLSLSQPKLARGGPA